MYASLRFFFLLLLLGCDWAGDPYFGTCPWSRPWSSQEMFCHSTVYRDEIRGACASDAGAHPVSIAEVPDDNLPSLLPNALRGPVTFPDDPALIYIFMSIQR
jgi:hypothetical protein